MIGPEELHELLHAHAASIEPNPHLAELGTALTDVERHRRARVVVGTTIVVVVVVAAVTVVRTIETRPTRFDTAPATERVVVAPTLPTVIASTDPALGATPTTAAPPTATLAPPGTGQASTGQAATGAGATPTATRPRSAMPPVTSPSGSGPPERVLTFRAASVSDLSSGNPPAVDYFGVAPAGTTVTATSAYGTASNQAGPDTQWLLHLVLHNAPVGQHVKVVLSAPPLPSLTFTFTHTAG